MRKIFFPFSKKYDQLSKHAWHRLAIVAYWILIMVSFFWMYHSLQSPQESNAIACLQMQMELHPGISIESMDAQCATSFPSTRINVLAAIIGTIIASYVIQILYYKVLLYIIFGKNIKEVA